jgi:hypothetical protein
MAIELTPDVSPESGGFGFQVPVFRMNQGVNAATANPLSRGGMGQPMDMVSESQFGLNPNVLAMADETARQQFYTGVDELNQFVNRAAEFGIDPSKVDMASPESFALNQEFRKRVQALQQQARGISTGAAQQAIVEREANLAFTQQQRARAEEDYLYTKEQRNKADVLERLGGDLFVNEFRILDALSKEGITRGDAAAKNEFMSRAASSVPGLQQAYDQANDQEKKIIKPYLDKALSYSKGEGVVFARPPQGPKPEKPEGPTEFEISNSPDLTSYQSGAFGRGVKYGNADLFGFKFEDGKLVVIGSEEVKNAVVEKNKEGKSVIKSPGTYEIEKPINNLTEAIKIINGAYSEDKVGKMVTKDLIERAKVVYKQGKQARNSGVVGQNRFKFNPNLLNPSKK